MNEKSKSKGRIKYLQCLEEKRYSFSIRKTCYVHIHTATPLPSKHTFLKSDLAYNIFFPICKKFGLHRKNHTCCVFFSFSAPRKCLVAMALKSNTRITSIESDRIGAISLFTTISRI